MINQSTTSDPRGGHSFIEGMDVFDVNGEKVGSVSWKNPEAGYLVIQKGWIFANELYVPYSNIVSQDSRGLFLDLSKDELKDERWKVPPTNNEMAAAAHPPMVGGAQLGGLAPAAPPTESSVEAPAQPVTPEPTAASVNGYEQPLSAPSLESGVRNDELSVDNRADSNDEQPVDVVPIPDIPGAETDQSSPSDADLNGGAQPLQAEQLVDVMLIPDIPDAETDQIDQPSVELTAEEQPLQAEQPVDVDVIPEASDDEVDQTSLSDADLNGGEQPLQTAGVGTNEGKQSKELEQRVLDRMEGAAAGVAAAQAFKHTGATSEENRSGAALRAALLVGFDVALKQDAAQMLSEPGPRGSTDPIAALLADVGPTETPELAPLLAAAWRAALAVASDNPSAAPQVRGALERLARD